MIYTDMHCAVKTYRELVRKVVQICSFWRQKVVPPGWPPRCKLCPRLLTGSDSTSCAYGNCSTVQISIRASCDFLLHSFFPSEHPQVWVLLISFAATKLLCYYVPYLFLKRFFCNGKHFSRFSNHSLFSPWVVLFFLCVLLYHRFNFSDRYLDTSCFIFPLLSSVYT